MNFKVSEMAHGNQKANKKKEKMRRKLSNTPINTRLDLKTRFI